MKKKQDTFILTETEREILKGCYRNQGKPWNNPYYAEDFRGLEKKGLIEIAQYLDEDQFLFRLTPAGRNLGQFIVEGKAPVSVKEFGPFKVGSN
jgi:hypothetical protein